MYKFLFAIFFAGLAYTSSAQVINPIKDNSQNVSSFHNVIDNQNKSAKANKSDNLRLNKHNEDNPHYKPSSLNSNRPKSVSTENKNQVQDDKHLNSSELWCGADRVFGISRMYFCIPFGIPDAYSYFSMYFDTLYSCYIVDYFSMGLGAAFSFVNIKHKEAGTSDFAPNFHIPIDVAVTIPFGIPNYGIRLAVGPRFSFNASGTGKVFSCPIAFSADAIIDCFDIAISYLLPTVKGVSASQGLLILGIGYYF